MESLVLHGDLYRTDNPYDGNFFTEMLVSKDKSEAIICTYRRNAVANPEIKRIRLRGLDKNKIYEISEREIVASGTTLMNAGLVVHFKNEDFTSLVYHVKEKL
jgi:alpha-galactosidase